MLPYRNDARGLLYAPGQVVSDDAIVAYLMADAPGCFAEYVEVKAAKGIEDKAAKPVQNKGLGL